MNLFRPDVQRMEGYIPGEQPQESGWIKLNTNENPYPPSPRVVAAIRQAAEGRLNLYPDPLARRFCERAAETFRLDPDWILPANGSDENLTILMRSFVDPGEQVAYPYPSYTLYETLAELQGAWPERLSLNRDWSWNRAACRPVIEQSKLVFVPNPNSPSGNRWPGGEILNLVPPEGLLVLDEAYGPFADRPHQGELLQAPEGERVILTRSLSKSHSLAGIRFGFAVGRPEWIQGMRKVKDSYNCNTLSLAAAVAALEDAEWVQSNIETIRATRRRLTRALRESDFHVVDSQANFVWATHPGGENRRIYENLKDRHILVRYMQFPEAGSDGKETIDGLRITVGTDEEINQFLATLEEIL